MQPNDQVLFDSICGDFNFDNISSTREAAQHHPLFHQFPDICSLSMNTSQQPKQYFSPFFCIYLWRMNWGQGEIGVREVCILRLL